MSKSLWPIVRTAMAVIGLVALGTGLYAAHSRLPLLLKEFTSDRQAGAVPAGQEVLVTVPKGASVSQVAGILEEQGVISSRLVFKLVAWIRGEQRKIKAGDYTLRTGADPGEVLDLLISGKTLVYNLTVPEGYNLFQMADLFQQQGIMSREEFLKTCRDRSFLQELGVDAPTLEGYLFPDTYQFRHSERSDGRLVIRRMVQHFNQVYDKNVREIADQNGWTVSQVITLASIIEKEAKPKEHALVSSVFHNRLRLGMRLQSDPTVIYGIKPMGSKITRADLDRKQPYNTYQVSGLPPGPIANPGKESLVAAVKPADADYLYFVANNDGTHEFSKNLKEHNRFVDMYQRQPRSEAR
jgi:UPF0755 protein